MPYLTVFEIRAGETRTLALDFTGKLPSGVGFAVSGHAVAAIDHFSGADTPGVLGGTTPEVSGLVAAVVVHNVAVGQRYEVTFTLTLDDDTPSVIKETVLVIGVSVLWVATSPSAP